MPPTSAPAPSMIETVLQAALDGAGLRADLAAHPAIRSWHAATADLREALPGVPARALLDTLVRVEQVLGEAPSTQGTQPEALATRLVESGALESLGAAGADALVAGTSSAADALARIARRELLLARLATLGDDGLRTRLVHDTEAARALLGTLREEPSLPLGDRVRRLCPELGALAAETPAHAALEHERGAAARRPRPLLDHLDRVLGRKLAGLEAGDRALFQRDEALPADLFEREVASWKALAARGLAPVVRAALLHLDFAKGGSAEQREAWRRGLGVDLGVHNLAARAILERAPAGTGLGAIPALRERPALHRLVLALVESHGLAGQAVRGETPLPHFARFVRYLRAEAADLGAALGCPAAEAATLALDALHAINVVDTAGVREGLLDGALHAELTRVEAQVRAVGLASGSLEDHEIERELAAREGEAWRERLPGATDEVRTRARLADRLARLRKGRLQKGEPRIESERAVDAIPAPALAILASRLENAQLWYAEAGSAALSPEAQLKVLALGVTAAVRSPRSGGTPEVAPLSAVVSAFGARPFHLTLLPLVATLGGGPGAPDRAVPYRVRLMEAVLRPLSFERILLGEAALPSALGAFEADLGGALAVEVTFEESEEARALLTLLPIYETKSQVAFHTTLKTLCDLYGLRKDEFDRISNEAAYLVHMNSARSDKARMLDHARPGRIVEVGPGGGVVLDLLEERFPSGEIIGVDVSRMVVEALQERKRREGRRWQIVEADAFRLPELMGPGTLDTVVYCSILHEIYSYVEFPSDANGEKGLFRLESVRELLRATWRALRPGGRIVVRDGVMPPPGERTLRFLTADAQELFTLFVAQWKGREVRFTPLAPEGGDRGGARLSSADAMEFLFKLTWGPESFPYEIREQYGVLPYDAYRDAVTGWLEGARWIELPPHERSYLQPGYRGGLEGKVRLLDEAGAPTSLPDSNAIWVYEKGGA